MKKSFLFIAVGILLVIGVLGFTSIEVKSDLQNQVLRHVVLIDLNEQANDSVVTMMNQDLERLKKNISQVRDLEFGTNIQKQAEYSHCIFLTFESVEDLKEYEQHPMHLEFASTYGKYLIKKTEVDYWY